MSKTTCKEIITECHIILDILITKQYILSYLLVLVLSLKLSIYDHDFHQSLGQNMSLYRQKHNIYEETCKCGILYLNQI